MYIDVNLKKYQIIGRKGYVVNLEYPLPNGQSVILLEDDKVYLGNQVEMPGSDKCYGGVADDAYLLVCEYGCGGTEPEIIMYKKRNDKCQ